MTQPPEESFVQFLLHRGYVSTDTIGDRNGSTDSQVLDALVDEGRLTAEALRSARGEYEVARSRTVGEAAGGDGAEITLDDASWEDLDEELEGLESGFDLPGREAITALCDRVNRLSGLASAAREAWDLRVVDLVGVLDLKSELEGLTHTPKRARWVEIESALADMGAKGYGFWSAVQRIWDDRVRVFRRRLLESIEERTDDLAVRPSAEIARERVRWWEAIHRMNVPVDVRITRCLFDLVEEERSAGELEQLQALTDVSHARYYAELRKIVSHLREPYCWTARDVLAKLGDKYDLGWAVATADSRLIELRGKTLPTKVRDERTGIDFVLVEPGAFMMGNADRRAKKDERPAHAVSLSMPYYIATTTVSVGHWRRFAMKARYHSAAEALDGSFGLAGASGKWDKQKRARWCDPFPSLAFELQEEHPAVHLDWRDAQAFCKEYGYRLPTEAEWEFACRAGSKTLFPWGDLDADGAVYGNFRDQSKRRVVPEWGTMDFDAGHELLAPVASFGCNDWGVSDMLGNVWEWCEDSYKPDAYKRSESIDPVQLEGEQKVARGGAWSLKPQGSARRAGYPIDHRIDDVGFRVVHRVDVPAPSTSRISGVFQRPAVAVRMPKWQMHWLWLLIVGLCVGLIVFLFAI